MRVAKGEQFPLELRDSRMGLRLPLPVAWRKVRRQVRRRLFVLGCLRTSLSLDMYNALEAEALAEQVSRNVLCQARGGGRKSKAQLARYFGTPEGRRAIRALATLRARAQEARLCV